MKTKAPKQLKLFRKEGVVFGGGKSGTHPTGKRPFSKKCDVHVVMRSGHAVGGHSLLRSQNRKVVKGIIEKYGKRFYVSIKRNVNVGNHIHLLIRAPNAQLQRDFLRTISALIARHVMKAHKGSPMTVTRFWDARPFTRLVTMGRAFRAVTHYLALNSLEAIGFSKFEARNYLLTLSTG